MNAHIFNYLQSELACTKKTAHEYMHIAHAVQAELCNLLPLIHDFTTHSTGLRISYRQHEYDKLHENLPKLLELHTKLTEQLEAIHRLRHVED